MKNRMKILQGRIEANKESEATARPGFLTSGWRRQWSPGGSGAPWIHAKMRYRLSVMARNLTYTHFNVFLSKN